MADLSNIRIDGGRLWDSLMEMAKIGATPKGGCKRLTLTDLDREGRALVHLLVQGGRLQRRDRRDGEHIRPPRRDRGRPSACDDGLAISTRSPRAGSSTACSACSERSRWCAR